MSDHIATLREFNAWRRGNVDPSKYDSSQKQIGIAIDALIAEVESLRKNEYIEKVSGRPHNGTERE